MQRDQLESMRHSCEHVLTQAILKLFPKVKMAMGPATDEGFYFDFDLNGEKITEKDFSKIEKEMDNIVKENLPITRKEITIDEAKKLFKDNPYKQEWIKEIKDKGGKVSIYYTGDKFVDLCAGPHTASTGKIGPFKLLSIAGAYWRGNEKNKMLTRIYGTCFATSQELDKYLWQIEEAKKRDHRKLGTQLGLWVFSDLVGAGLPLYTQKGALVRRLLNEFVENIQSKQGIAQVWTPQIAKAELFKISGHYEKYKENLFQVKSNYSEEEFYLKPMNCPQHTQIFSSAPRTYKDLPIRMADFAMLYRDEKPGELMGLIRTRSFSQDDCHIFCREDQIIEEMNKALDMTKLIMDTFGFKYKYRLSLKDPNHPEKYVGDEETWNKAEKLSEKILKDRNVNYFVGLGEAAFYAPKLDLIVTDSLGRDWQLSTLQIDFFLPERFKLEYIDADGSRKTPVMLHRAILGSSERLLGILIEHYAGAFPLWLSPTQISVLPISEKQLTKAKIVYDFFNKYGFRAELEDENKTIGYKIRQTTLKKIPYMIIIGDKEIEKSDFNDDSGKKIFVSVRSRDNKDNGIVSLYELMQNLRQKIEKFQ